MDITCKYLCTVQPSEGSPLAVALEKATSDSCSCYGVDDTGLYPPHVTVTGFFVATYNQAERLCRAATMLVEQKNLMGPLSVEVLGVLSTDDGYVILNVAAPGVAQLASALAVQGDVMGVHIRAKSVRHMSLARGRGVEDRARIVELYQNVLPTGICPFELVISQLVYRSSLEHLVARRQAHAFYELLRLPLSIRRDAQPLPLPYMLGATSACSPVVRAKADTHAEVEQRDQHALASTSANAHCGNRKDGMSAFATLAWCQSLCGRP